ncbi:GNAT family N-acetyltransferase [Saccharopolyspora aridisoli]|nr:GNAT family N-acetyltransferase [Saccharopolyspora aridisoli]
MSGMDEISIRPAGPDDVVFLEDMLVEAANTPSHPGRSRAEALAEPAVAHYVEGWPRATDLGVVAERSARPIGAAWLRYFDEAAPAYGFVSPDVPELAIGVDAASRGGGVGRKLLRSLFHSARARGIDRISLSVERANPAARLYVAEGFTVVDRREHADTMLLTF